MKMRHECHAEACRVVVPPRMLMCARHWRMVSPQLQQEIWDAYRPGQERDKNPSYAYMAAHHRAVAYVARVQRMYEAAEKHEQFALFYDKKARDSLMDESVVAGDRLPRSIADFVRACEVLIVEEQGKLLPNTELISTLCDAVRLAREHVKLAKTIK